MNNNIMYKIVADSSCDIVSLENTEFATASLKISTAEREFTDDCKLNVKNMVEYLHGYKGKSRSSCPNPEDWMKAFGEASHIFCVTMTSKLSGTYNSAMLAKKKYEEKYPDRKVHVFDSLSTGPEMVLILRKLDELANNKLDFDAIIKEVNNYSSNTGLMFVLESMQNLANNGRVSAITAKIAGVLGIRLLGKATDGELEPLDKCRGEKKAFAKVVERLVQYGVKTGKISITHCINENAAIELKSLINKEIPDASVDIRPCGGLCSFYAEKGGLLIGYEKY